MQIEIGIMLNGLSLCKRVGLNHRGVFKGEVVQVKGGDLTIKGVTDDGMVITTDGKTHLAKHLNLSWKTSRNVVIPDQTLKQFLILSSA